MAAFGVPASGEGSRWVVPQSGSPRSSSHGVCVKTGSGQQTAGLCGEAAGRPQAMVPVGGGGGCQALLMQHGSCLWLGMVPALSLVLNRNPSDR